MTDPLRYPTMGAVVAFEFLRRTPRPPMTDRNEHHASRSAYWERVVRGRPAAHAVAALTAAYDLAMQKLDGTADTAFAHQRAAIARAEAEHPWDAVDTMAAYVAEVESGLIPRQSPPRMTDGVGSRALSPNSRVLSPNHSRAANRTCVLM